MINCEESMKKLLVLGGANVHCKLVEAAKEMGIYTIVTDYLRSSESKMIADESHMVNITDIDGLVQLCKDKSVSAVLSTHLDPCQRPYQTLCQSLDFFCYGDKDQFFKMTDKHAFKQMCKENGVDVIPEYTIEDVLKDNVEYPLFIKPVDSRGSRGQTVCWKKEEALSAISFAEKESSNGDILIEKYLNNVQEVQITYFFINGKPYLIRTVDSYNGKEEEHLEKIVACSISPSQYTEEYLATAHENVVKMFRNMGFHDGPIFMQGFYDNGRFRFFDPGLRFPGVDYDRVYRTEYGIDLMKMMVSYALNGKMPINELPKDMYNLRGKRAAVLFPVIRAGVIADIKGVDVVRSDKRVFSYLQRHTVTGEVGWTYNVNQRFAEIDILASDTEDLKEAITSIQNSLSVRDTRNEEMLYEHFDVNRIV